LACGRRQLLDEATEIATDSHQGVHLGQIGLGSADINSRNVTSSLALSPPHTLIPSVAWRDERSVPLP
jgi:hypothetical protein